MDTERIESALFNCRKALKLLHPNMDENEPCFIYEVYKEAGEVLIELEDASQSTVEVGRADAEAERQMGMSPQFADRMGIYHP